MLESLLKKSNWKDVLIILISAVAIIGIWRGIWNLLDEYFLVNSFVGSQVVPIVAGIWLLLILSRYK